MRKKHTILNIVTGLISQIILIFLGFYSRRIFVNILGFEILGLNGLFSSIITMLSLAELGIGSAIYFSLYKPIANSNYNQIQAIMFYYSKIYKKIALSIGFFGIVISPLLVYIVKIDYANMYIVYFLFILDVILSYAFSYKKSIISAKQKNYIISTIQTIFSILTIIFQIYILKYTGNYLFYILSKILFGLLSNIVFYYIANYLNPYLKDTKNIELDIEIKNDIIRNSRAIFLAQLSVYFISGTDNLFISTFISISMVGIYSNYLLIINTITNLTMQIFESINASFGNLLINESKLYSYQIFKYIYFINFWVIAFSANALLVLTDTFINLWIGYESLLPINVVFILIGIFVFRGLNRTIGMVRNSSGLFSPYPFFKYWAILEGLLNLILSFIFIYFLKLGIFGLTLATLISTQMNTIVLPINVFKFVFKLESEIVKYFKIYATYLLTILIIIMISSFLASIFITQNLFQSFLIKVFISFIVPNVIIVLFFNKTSEFKFIFKTLSRD